MIKKAKFDDLISIMSLIELNSDTFSAVEILSAKRYLKRFINKQNKENKFFIWINSTGEALGCGGYSKQDDADGVYFLCWLAVHPDFKRKGIATELCNYIENKLKTLNARLLILNAGSNETNRFFYKKRGFRIAGIIPQYYSQEKDLVWYYKSLKRN